MNTIIGFVGLGHMGGPMAVNLIKNGYKVIGYDLLEEHREKLKSEGGAIADSLAELANACDVIITMLPAGQHVETVCTAVDGLFEHAKAGTLFIDSSSIDVATARRLAMTAKTYDLAMIDAPVSGGMTGAQAGTLTFMVGGEDAHFEQAKPILNTMGKRTFHAGQNGNGQAAKICNNMLLGITMVGVGEAFNLAEKLGLNTQAFFDICEASSGQCWALSNYCPAPGPVPKAPSNHNYEPGFASAMMLKDLKLSQLAAQQNGVATPLGAEATTLYELFNQQGFANKDFSAIIKMLRGE